MAFNIGATKGPKKVPNSTLRAQFVLGSRPETLRAPPVPRVKPMAAGTTQYGKPASKSPTSGFGFGDTGAI